MSEALKESSDVTPPEENKAAKYDGQVEGSLSP